MAGALNPTNGFITVASKVGAEVLASKVNMPDDFGLPLLPTILGGLLLGPKVNEDEALGFVLAGSNLKENGVADLAGPDESSKLGSDETGSPLTCPCVPAGSAELGKTEVALDVMTKVGREAAVIVRAFALISSSLVTFTFTFSACSCGFENPLGERLCALKSKLKLEEGGSNLNSDFGRIGEGAGNADGLGEDGTGVPSAWKLYLNLLGSLGAELNLLRDAVEPRAFVGLVEALEIDDPSSLIGMIRFGLSFVFSFCSVSMSMSSNSSIVISGSGATIGVLWATERAGPRPLTESLVRFVDR